ncbi:hypothetical protein AcW1_003834 [Taiwanofungus camphoratus]|nr:hypothetical protein AcW1_003834 [Antrodia cinnamomea]
MFLRPCMPHAIVLRRCAKRALATDATVSLASSESSAPPFPDSKAGVKINPRKARSSQRTEVKPGLFVRPWDGISSMAEVFAMIRGIERKYGRIREYIIPRDRDLPHLYIPYFWVLLHDPWNYERVPNRTVLKVPVPNVDPSRPGGIGLEDLQGLLYSQDRTRGPMGSAERVLQDSSESDDGDSKTRTVDLRIEHAKVPFRVAQQDRKWSPDIALLDGFYSWGGFYEPVDEESAKKVQHMQFNQARWAKKRTRRTTESASSEEGSEELLEVALQQSVVEERDDNLQTQTEASEFTDDVSKQLDVPSTSVSPPLASDIAEATLVPPTPDAIVADETPLTLNPAAAPAEQKAPRLSRRERILAQARENARMPLPESVTMSKQEKKTRELSEREKTQKEREEETQVRLSMRDRLWKLMGSKWF